MELDWLTKISADTKPLNCESGLIIITPFFFMMSCQWMLLGLSLYTLWLKAVRESMLMIMAGNYLPYLEVLSRQASLKNSPDALYYFIDGWFCMSFVGI